MPEEKRVHLAFSSSEIEGWKATGEALAVLREMSDSPRPHTRRAAKVLQRAKPAEQAAVAILRDYFHAK